MVGKMQCLGFDSSVCKLDIKFHERDILLSHILYYVERRMFFKKKVKIAGVILLLLGIVIACRVGGEYLYDHINTEIETAGKTNIGQRKTCSCRRCGTWWR